jgi:SagB-type dehydrogenase family enzyme
VIDLTRYDEVIRQRREILKAHDYDAIPEDGWWEPHQRKGIAAPPLEKPFSAGSPLVDLPRPEEATIGRMPLSDVIAARRSRRRFEHEPLTLEELSFLLWSTQGVRTVDKNEVWTLRNVPSGGARQPFETYLLVRNVENLVPGVYRYLPLEHKVIQVAEAGETFEKRIVEACNGQSFAGKSAVVFVWATIPYRTEWRYSIRAYKDIAMEAGHVCQNLYLSCESIGAGTCAIANYNQRKMDSLIKVDGENEFTVYLAPVGRAKSLSEGA